jgi:hypothetical protein
MDSFLSGLVNQFGGDAVGAVAGRLGIPPETAKKAFSVAAPAAMAALASQASRRDGATGLMRTLTSLTGGGATPGGSATAAGLGGLLGGLVGGGGGGLGQMLGGLLKDPAAKNLFGDRMGAVETGLAKQVGVKPQAMESLLGMTAPAVMSSVAGLVKSKGLDAAGLTSFLDGEVKSLAKEQPDLMGSIGGFLGRIAGGATR